MHICYHGGRFVCSLYLSFSPPPIMGFFLSLIHFQIMFDFINNQDNGSVQSVNSGVLKNWHVKWLQQKKYSKECCVVLFSFSLLLQVLKFIEQWLFFWILGLVMWAPECSNKRHWFLWKLLSRDLHEVVICLT